MPYAVEGLPAVEHRKVTELLLYPQQLVVLGDALAPRGRARLYLACVRRHGQVGDEGVLRLSRSVRYDARITGFLCHPYRRERLGDGPYLVQLDQYAVCDALLDPSLEYSRIRHENVVPHDLHLIRASLGELLPPLPVVLGEAVLDGDDRIVSDEGLVESDKLVRISGIAVDVVRCSLHRTPRRRGRGR